MSVKQKLRGITPLFQKVLLEQVGRILSAFSEGDHGQAYADMETLIDSLKEEHSEPLLQNDIKHIETLLKEARRPKTGSFYRGLLETSTNQESVMRDNARLLYRKIMRLLHKHGYLEIVSRTPRFFEPGIKPEQIE